MTSSFKVSELPRKKEKGSAKKKTIVITAALLLLAGAGWLIVHFGFPPHAPDPAKLTTDNAVKYLASNEFAALPEKEKMSYMERMRAKNGDNPRVLFSVKMSDAERAKIMQNTIPMMHKMMKERTAKFFAMSKAEQDKELDRIIAEMEARRKSGNMMPPGGPPGGGGRPSGPGGPGPGFIKGMLENTDSTTRAQMGEFMKRMHQRMQEKGISGPGAPPR